jgi:hypothetical protein
MIESHLPDPASLILVAVMNSSRDLEIARLLGWYRIPLRNAPKVISVDYLAFYQTAAFGEDKWRIQFLAQVLGHELTTRLELIQDEPEHPNAHLEYFKIQVGPLIQLEKPIIADQWRRITFFYTTGEHLLHSQSIRDLIVQPDERQMLWKVLRERASETQRYSSDELPKLELDPEILAAVLGLKETEGNYSISQITPDSQIQQ